MPARNCGRYLNDAIESVLAQSVGDLELILYDDASTDETAEVTRGVRDARVRCFRHASQRGIPETRNSCLRVARGRFVVWLDADDRLLPGALAALRSAVERRPTIGLAHGAFDVIAEDGRALPAWPMPFDTDVVEQGPRAFAELVVSNYITAPVIVRRECHDAVGPYATDMGPSSTDWEMWLRLALHADLAYVARPVAQYRQHGGSITRATHRPGARLRCDAAAVARVFAAWRHRIPDAEATERRARIALLAKALLFARDAVARDDWPGAAEAVHGHQDAAARCAADPAGVLAALAERDELAFHRESGALLGGLQPSLSGTRLGDRQGRVTASDASWDRMLESIATTVRGLVPANACVAAVDKWDPTLLHLAERTGYHFPDRRLMPDGYPPDSESAIAHLEELRRRGASYLVFPCAAFWWLEYYGAFAGYLETTHETVWRDEQCVIFHLEGRAA